MGKSGPAQPDLIENGQVRLLPITAGLIGAEGGAAQAAPLPAELTTYRPDNYTVNAGDTLLVTVWDHPELTTPAGSQQQAVSNGRLVRPDGTFYFPYAGEMKVTGMTIEQVRRELAKRLARFIQDPQVDVNVVGYGSRVSLGGALTNNAPQDITPVPLTVSQAIGRAGINVEQADLSGLMLTRDGRSYRIDLDALNRDGAVAPEIYLKPGDQLFLPFNDRKEVFVLGEVVRPQPINFKTSDMTLTQALGRSGGLNPLTSNGKAVYVIRGAARQALAMQGQRVEGQGPLGTIYHLDAGSPAAFVLADQFRLAPGDVVFVGAAGITRWSRFVSQLVPFSGLLRNAAAAGTDFGN